MTDHHSKWGEEVDTNQGMKTKGLPQTTERRVTSFLREKENKNKKKKQDKIWE